MSSPLLRLAVPNKGRLVEGTNDLLTEAGLDFEQSARALSARVRNVDIELLFVRADDVAELVDDGVAHIGVTGQDLVAEYGAALPVLLELGFGHCQLAAAVPKSSPVEKLEDLAGLRVATAHPAATGRIFADRSIDVTLVPLHGSVEVAPKLGIADAIVDLVSTGSTMLVNGLRPVDVLLNSQAVLVANDEALGAQAEDIDRLTLAIAAVTSARRKRYVLLNAPSDSIATIVELIPGLGAPTIVPLAEDGMVAVHSVVEADTIWNLLPRLRAAGGRDILVMPITQLIP